jgi:hypothetical protein
MGAHDREHPRPAHGSPRSDRSKGVAGQSAARSDIRVQRFRDPFKRYLQRRPFDSFSRLHRCRAYLSAAPPAGRAGVAASRLLCKQRVCFRQPGTGRVANPWRSREVIDEQPLR